jgi:hypothetical protein
MHKTLVKLLCSLGLDSAVNAQTNLINVDFNAGTTTTKTGAAAFGLTGTDFWNTANYGAYSNLKYSDNTASVVDLSIYYASVGNYGTGSSDVMFHDYVYPNPGNSPSGGNIDVTISSLPAGTYDFYVYAHGIDDRENGIITLESASCDYGTKETSTASGWNKTSLSAWEEGKQFVLFRNVVITTNGTIYITASPSTNDNAAINGLQIVKRDPSVMNIDFGVGTSSSKSGLAATGNTSGDFWNLYSRDDGFGGYRTLGTVSNLKWWNGIVSSAAITVQNAPGAWGTGVSDSMFAVYLYPFNSSNIVATITNLPSGTYQFYVYGHGNLDSINGVYSLASNGVGYGTQSTTTTSGWASSTWTAGQQYVLYDDVVVVAGQPVVITSSPGSYGLAVINGLQIKQIDPCN